MRALALRSDDWIAYRPRHDPRQQETRARYSLRRNHSRESFEACCLRDGDVREMGTWRPGHRKYSEHAGIRYLLRLSRSAACSQLLSGASLGESKRVFPDGQLVQSAQTIRAGFVHAAMSGFPEAAAPVAVLRHADVHDTTRRQRAWQLHRQWNGSPRQ